VTEATRFRAGTSCAAGVISSALSMACEQRSISGGAEVPLSRGNPVQGARPEAPKLGRGLSSRRSRRFQCKFIQQASADHKRLRLSRVTPSRHPEDSAPDSLTSKKEGPGRKDAIERTSAFSPTWLDPLVPRGHLAQLIG